MSFILSECPHKKLNIPKSSRLEFEIFFGCKFEVKDGQCNIATAQIFLQKQPSAIIAKLASCGPI